MDSGYSAISAYILIPDHSFYSGKVFFELYFFVHMVEVADFLFKIIFIRSMQSLQLLPLPIISTSVTEGERRRAGSLSFVS